MKIAIRYYTRSGNTETLARAIEDKVGVKAESVAVPLPEKADILFLGCSYYAFDVDEAVKNFVTQNQDRIGRIVCFGTSAMMRSIRKPMQKVCDAAGVPLSDEEFHCRGSFGPMHKGPPDEKDLTNAAAFAKKILDS